MTKGAAHVVVVGQLGLLGRVEPTRLSARRAQVARVRARLPLLLVSKPNGHTEAGLKWLIENVGPRAMSTGLLKEPTSWFSPARTPKPLGIVASEFW